MLYGNFTVPFRRKPLKYGTRSKYARTKAGKCSALSPSVPIGGVFP